MSRKGHGDLYKTTTNQERRKQKAKRRDSIQSDMFRTLMRASKMMVFIPFSLETNFRNGFTV